MKNLILIALVFVFTGANAQVLTVNDAGLIEVKEVVMSDGMTADQLFTNANNWFNSTYKSDAKRQKASDAGTIKDTQIFKREKGGGVFYDVSIMVKGGKYRIVMTNFMHKDFSKGACSGGKLEREEALCRQGKMSEKEWQEIKDFAATETTALIESIKEGMAIVIKKASDDW